MSMNYSKIYDQIISRAKTRIPEGYVERHHIIPKCMGGSDDNENLVALYPEEHFVAHVLLVKVYPEHKGLISAVQHMTVGHAGRRTKRKLYGWLKRRFAVYMRESQTAEGNSQFGTVWITNGEISKKIKKNDAIPDGWRKGRKDPLSAAARAKVVEMNVGRKPSPETRLKMSCSQKKKTMPDDAKTRISKSMREVWESRRAPIAQPERASTF